ncbi:penicillin-binding protein 2 [Patescibacteria group bacterium]|nr:penicillin-binding protein 2 [Patescibacteria group bacterium]
MYLNQRYNNNSNNVLIGNFRINTLQWVIFLLILIIIIRLFYLQVLQNDKYKALASQQHKMVTVLQPERGEIFALTDKKETTQLYPLAVNQISYEVYADPSKVTRPQNLADILVEILAVDPVETLAKLEKTGDQYEVIKKNVDQTAIDALTIKLDELLKDTNKDKLKKDRQANTGVAWNKEILRFYPDKEVGAHILGFLGYAEDGVTRVGKYGLEGFWQKDLVGLGTQVVGERDMSGRALPFSELAAMVENGADLVLTIDRTVQYQACKALEKSVIRHGAKSGSVIVMETSTGAIRAMCGYPSFDPNNYSQVEDGNVYNNLAVYDSYEPGSVMKAISMAIAVDTGHVTADTIYEDKGEIKFAGGFTVRNSDLKAHGVVDMTQVLVESLNTGVIFASKDIKNKIYEDYMKQFGFGEAFGLEISQEAKGDISALSKKGDIYKATSSYGQGITVTPLQLLSAVNVLANGGNLMKPYLVSELKKNNGQIEKFEPTTLNQVISQGTASTLSAMLTQVVEQGHSKQAAVPGYYIAGKTGTAQVANPETGRYYDASKVIHSFVGFAPVESPKFTMLTKLDFPTSAPYAESTAAPLFGEIAKFLLEYYQIPPTR